MTNLHILLITVGVLLTAIGVAVAVLHRLNVSQLETVESNILGMFNAHLKAMHGVQGEVLKNLYAESDFIRLHAAEMRTSVKDHVASEAEKVTKFLATHADSLEKHAQEIKAHSIETHDRAVSREIAPREAVKRT